MNFLPKPRVQLAQHNDPRMTRCFVEPDEQNMATTAQPRQYRRRQSGSDMARRHMEHEYAQLRQDDSYHCERDDVLSEAGRLPGASAGAGVMERKQEAIGERVGLDAAVLDREALSLVEAFIRDARFYDRRRNANPFVAPHLIPDECSYTTRHSEAEVQSYHATVTRLHSYPVCLFWLSHWLEGGAYDNWRQLLNDVDVMRRNYAEMYVNTPWRAKSELLCTELRAKIDDLNQRQHSSRRPLRKKQKLASSD